MSTSLNIVPIEGLPMVEPGDDLVALIAGALTPLEPVDGDVIVIAQKIVSKAEGRLVALASVTPSPEAERLAAETDKDPRLVQLVLDESVELVRKKTGVLIMRHRLGLVGAHAGIDQSNIRHDGGEHALLLPADPDASARRLKDGLDARLGVRLAVLIADSMNRPWRLGTLGTAIGVAGFRVLDDRRGDADLYGRELMVTLINRADALAAAATLIMGETTERTPATLVRGFAFEETADTARDMLRPLDEDLFR